MKEQPYSAVHLQLLMIHREPTGDWLRVKNRI